MTFIFMYVKISVMAQKEILRFVFPDLSPEGKEYVWISKRVIFLQIMNPIPSGDFRSCTSLSEESYLTA